MVAVLFAMKGSVYHSLPCDVYDKERDARTFPGGCPVVAHPPCRSWGHLKHFARPEPGERENALWAVGQVRQWGGVLEHPVYSSLWEAAGLPAGRNRDAWGGWTLPVSQWWWGHPCEKRTWLYICGVEPRDMPPMPYRIGEAEFVVSTSRGRRNRREIKKSEREATPPDLAEWLLAVAQLAGRKEVA